MLTLQQIMAALNRFAPWDLAEGWDQVGLQIGRAAQKAERILIALDMNERVLEEGLARQVDGFIIHHPFFFKPLTRVDTSSPSGRIMARLLKEDLFLIAAHTNIDKAAGGLNQYLAELLGLQQIEVLEPVAAVLYKIVVFVPLSYANQLREKMAQAGAGQIGGYTACSFQTQGTGSFRPGPAARPFIGQAGVMEEVPETRLEMQADGESLERILEAVRSYHPYEEPVIDVYPLQKRAIRQNGHGLGRIGLLPGKISLGQFSETVKAVLSLDTIRLLGQPDASVDRVALCTGSGGDLLKQALHCGAALYLTGELHYHDYLAAAEAGLAVIEAGHWGTEHIFGSLMAGFLTRDFANENLEVIQSQAVTKEPFITL